MEKLNRTIPPVFHTIDKVNLLKSKQMELSNKIPMHIINGGSQEVVKIEFVFQAGIWFQESKVIAAMTNSMLNEGTFTMNAHQIAEKLDYYGAYLGFTTNTHSATVTLYSLNKYLDHTLPIVEDVIKNSNFPEKEFNTILNNKKQNYIVEHQKTKILAKDSFLALLYGKEHPYANNIQESDFDKVTRDKLVTYHKQHYTPSNCRIIIAGKITPEVITQLEEKFGETAWPATKSQAYSSHNQQDTSPQKIHIEKKDSVQSAIRIGRKLFNKTHPDYIGMQLLNMVLGGYFGSRLMSNIREDKGYTYSIGSIHVPYPEGGHFVILTEVGTQVCSEALKEIYFEIARLRNELIPEEELELVKNYITGEILRNLDGPFALSESLRSNLPYGMDNSYYQDFLTGIRKISAEKLRELANTYLQEKDLYEIVAGHKENNSQ
ncbi:MAG: M16 family metallopeptidase [Marinifilaceae bacterium]|jgi:predicted Zn-dependent peptidase